MFQQNFTPLWFSLPSSAVYVGVCLGAVQLEPLLWHFCRAEVFFCKNPVLLLLAPMAEPEPELGSLL